MYFIQTHAYANANAQLSTHTRMNRLCIKSLSTNSIRFLVIPGLPKILQASFDKIDIDIRSRLYVLYYMPSLAGIQQECLKLPNGTKLCSDDFEKNGYSMEIEQLGQTIRSCMLTISLPGEYQFIIEIVSSNGTPE